MGGDKKNFHSNVLASVASAEKDLITGGWKWEIRGKLFDESNYTGAIMWVGVTIN